MKRNEKQFERDVDANKNSLITNANNNKIDTLNKFRDNYFNPRKINDWFAILIKIKKKKNKLNSKKSSSFF